MGKSLYEKIWESHHILDEHGASLLYVDKHLLHEGSRNAFVLLRERGLQVARPKQTYAFADHLIPVRNQPKSVSLIRNLHSRGMAEEQVSNCESSEIRLFGLGDPDQGIVHVVGPEQGLTQPGNVIVCGDSHTSTHGAFACLAFGIGSTEVSHVLATQCLWQRKSRNVKIEFVGKLGGAVGPKDLILALIARVGANGGSGAVFEYSGEVINEMTMDERMTLCNMSVESGARAGLIAVDDKTIEYLKGRPYSPTGESWKNAEKYWRTLKSDADAQFDETITFDCSLLEPQVTWGTSPEDVVQITGKVPDKSSITSESEIRRVEASFAYMGIEPGERIQDIVVDRVFIGSCTNGRLDDLRDAAKILTGKKVSIPTMIVPGSTRIKIAAESEGLDKIFIDAGAEWLASGCSMCLGMNGDIGKPGERCASTSNRNFKGRQGPGVRTHLMSPLMAAATAIEGKIADPRRYS